MDESLRRALSELLTEILDGPPAESAWLLNPGDAGLLRSLEALDAGTASRPAPAGGASVAAHVDHLRYGFELLNRWSGGRSRTRMRTTRRAGVAGPCVRRNGGSVWKRWGRRAIGGERRFSDRARSTRWNSMD